MKTIPTANLVFGAMTIVFSPAPGGIGGLEPPSVLYALCVLAGKRCLRSIALRKAGDR